MSKHFPALIYIPRALFGALCFALLLGSFNTAQAQSVPKKRIVEIDGHKVQVAELGLLSPTVVFVAGLGEDLGTWRKVQPLVAQFANSMSYDRSGLGGSDARPGAKNIASLVAELDHLLKGAGHAPPYVVVGHSLGGAVAIEYARLHKRDVAGLVLVDPEDQRLLDTLKMQLPSEVWKDREAALANAMPSMPPGVRAEFAALPSTTVVADAYRTDIPTILLTGTKKNPQFPGNPLEQDLKLALHVSDIRGMSRVEHVIVPESRHYIQSDVPELLAQKIGELVQRSRTGQPGKSRQ